MKCITVIISFIVFTTPAQFEPLPADVTSIKIVPIHPQKSFNLSKYVAKQKVLRKPKKRYGATRLVSGFQEDEAMKPEASKEFIILNNSRNKMVQKHRKPRTFNENRIHKKDLSLHYDNPDVLKDTKENIIKEKYVNKKDIIKEKDDDTKESSEESDENKIPILRNADIDLNYDIDAPLLRIMW